MITGPNNKRYRDVDSYIQDLINIAYNLGIDSGVALSHREEDYDPGLANAECDKDNDKFTQTFGYELE